MGYPILHGPVSRTVQVATEISTTLADLLVVPLVVGNVKASTVEVFFRWQGLTGGDVTNTIRILFAARRADAGADPQLDSTTYNRFKRWVDFQSAYFALSNDPLFPAAAAPPDGSAYAGPVFIGSATNGPQGRILPGNYLAIAAQQNHANIYDTGTLFVEALVY